MKKNIAKAVCATILFLLVIATMSCSGRRRGMPSRSADLMGPQLPNGTSDSVSGDMGPAPQEGFFSEDQGYVVVFSPGMARALAHVGVLKEFEIAKTPIRALIGVEMGALLATIWASSGQNTLEWQTHKLLKDTIVDYAFFGLKQKPAEGRKLMSFLEKSLRTPALEKMRVTTFIASAADAGSERFRMEAQGDAREILRGAMAVEGIMQPYEYAGVNRVAANTEAPMPADHAKQLGIGKVLCVDAVGSSASSTAKDALERNYRELMGPVSVAVRRELKYCDEVITINTDSIGFFEFEKKAAAVSLGRKAAREWLKKVTAGRDK